MYRFKTLFNRLIAYFLFCLIVLPHFDGLAQKQQTIDSLQKKLQHADSRERYNIYFNLFIEYLNLDYEQSYQMSSLALKEAINLKDSLGIVKAYRAQGYALTELGKTKEGIESFLKALIIAEKNGYQDLQKFLLNNIAIAYTYIANYDKALEYHFKSLVVREKDGVQSEIAIANNNIGLVYYKLKDFERAYEYYTRSLQIKNEVKDEYDLDRLKINISLCLIELRKYKEAIQQVNEAFRLCCEKCSERTNLEGRYSKAIAYLYLLNYDSAFHYFSEAKVTAQRINDKRFYAESLIGIAKIQSVNNEVDYALNTLQEAEILLSGSGLDEELIKVYKDIANIYKSQNNYQNASLYQTKYIDLKDSVFSESLIRNLSRVQTDYEERENIATIAAKDQVIILKEESIQKQKRLNYAIGIIALLFISLAFILYHANRVRLRAHRALQIAKSTIEEQNKALKNHQIDLQQQVNERTAELDTSLAQLKHTHASLVSVKAELDNFVYKIAHDIRGPLASLIGLCHVAIGHVKDPTGLDYLLRLEVTAKSLNHTLSRLMTITDISNKSLELGMVNLKELIDSILEEFQQQLYAKDVEARIKIKDGTLVYADEFLLKTIVENLIANAIKFNNDSERIHSFFEVSIVQGNEFVEIHFVDNGIGLSLEDAGKIFRIFARASFKSEKGGVGLYISKVAVERMGGKIDFAHTPDNLSDFIVRLPLQSQMAERIALSNA